MELRRSDYEERKQRILSDFAASFWLREAVQSLERRDCVDALHDAQALVGLCELRVQSVLEANKGRNA